MRVVLALLVNALRLLFLPFLLARRDRAAPAQAFVTLEIDGAVTEVAARRRRFGLAGLFTRAPRALAIEHVRAVVDALLEDPGPRGLLVTVKSLRAGMATATALRTELARVRAAGRELVVHLPVGADTREVFVATAASRLFVGPRTNVAPVGFAVNARYVRGALAKAGVTPEVYARGTYKSAGETLTRDEMSEAQREQLEAIVEERYATLVAAIAEGRGIDLDRARALVDGAPYRSNEAVREGLVDGEAYEDELEGLLGGAKTVPAGRYLRARRAGKMTPVVPRGVVGVVRIHGPIASSAAALPVVAIAAEDPIVRTLRAARHDPRVRGVVLHVSSPGGSALASDRIHREVVLLAREKPVVACLSDVAASGGYYVAAPAHLIVAQPSTLTGSIGVVAARFVPEPLFERLGVKTSGVRRGARAGLLDPTGPLSDDERETIHRELERTYEDFVTVVAEGRNRTFEEICRVAEGRVWTGSAALEHGLVDRLGGFEAALDEVRARIGDPKARVPVSVLRAPRGSLPASSRAARSAAVAEAARLLGVDELGGGLAGAAAEALVLGACAARERVLAWVDVAGLV